MLDVSTMLLWALRLDFVMSFLVVSCATVCAHWTIAIDDSADGVTGRIPTYGYRLLPSYYPSKTIRSLAAVSYATPSRIRLLGLRLPLNESDTLACRFAVVDTNGNVIAGLAEHGTQWNLSITSRDTHTYVTPLRALLYQSPWVTRRLNIALCLDGSGAMASYRAIIADALDTLRYALGPYDSLMVIVSDAIETQLLPLTLRSECAHLPTLVRTTTFHGLNRLLRSTLFTLHNTQLDALIIVTASDDHASYDVLPSDLIELARQRDIPIYCIVLGTQVETLPFEVMSLTTGGMFYRHFTPAHVPEIAGTLLEIIRGLQTGSSAVALLSNLSNHDFQSTSTLSIRCTLSTSWFADSLVLPQWNAYSINPARQIVALFRYGSATIDSLYAPTVASLAKLLRNNPSQVIELIAHAYLEGSAAEMRQLSLERARAVEYLLLQHGVSRSQVRLRAMGDIKPVWFNTNDPVYMEFNRRVEFRWLDSSLLPYELVVAYAYREQDALRALHLWEKRGYQAYIEDIMLAGAPAFRIKLWGYPTYHQAKKAASSIAARYGVTATIE